MTVLTVAGRQHFESGTVVLGSTEEGCVIQFGGLNLAVTIHEMSRKPHGPMELVNQASAPTLRIARLEAGETACLQDRLAIPGASYSVAVAATGVAHRSGVAHILNYTITR